MGSPSAHAAIAKYVAAAASRGGNPVANLYRTISKQVPRVLTIYDADLAPEEARKAVRELFLKNANIKDPQVVNMLVKKGYMELEETLMQWKQKTHLLRLLNYEAEAPRKYKPRKNLTEKFLAGKFDD